MTDGQHLVRAGWKTANDRGLRLTADSRSIVARHVGNARVLRAWGAVA